MAVNKYWEDDFDESTFDCHKEAYNERERLRQENSTRGWIYVGVDVERSGEVKVGETTGNLGTRASSSHNPHYTPYHAFKIKEGVSSAKVKEIEKDLHGVLARHYDRINHYGSDKPTEWFKRKSDNQDEAGWSSPLKRRLRSRKW